MRLVSLNNYRVRKEDSYYNSGYYIADLISMHNSLCHLEGVKAEYELVNNKCLACVDYLKDGNVVEYNPFSIARDTTSDELVYIVAHELEHVKNRDFAIFNLVSLSLLALALGVSALLILFMTTITTLLLLPFIALTLVLGDAMFSRRRETMADIGALEYTSVFTVIRHISESEPDSRYKWLLYDHATTNTFMRWYLNKVQNERNGEVDRYA